MVWQISRKEYLHQLQIRQNSRHQIWKNSGTISKISCPESVKNSYLRPHILKIIHFTRRITHNPQIQVIIIHTITIQIYKLQIQNSMWQNWLKLPNQWPQISSIAFQLAFQETVLPEKLPNCLTISEVGTNCGTFCGTFTYACKIGNGLFPHPWLQYEDNQA